MRVICTPVCSVLIFLVCEELPPGLSLCAPTSAVARFHSGAALMITVVILLTSNLYYPGWLNVCFHVQIYCTVTRHNIVIFFIISPKLPYLPTFINLQYSMHIPILPWLTGQRQSINLHSEYLTRQQSSVTEKSSHNTHCSMKSFSKRCDGNSIIRYRFREPQCDTTLRSDGRFILPILQIARTKLAREISPHWLARYRTGLVGSALSISW